jgi:hypothetical protein
MKSNHTISKMKKVYVRQINSKEPNVLKANFSFVLFVYFVVNYLSHKEYGQKEFSFLSPFSCSKNHSRASHFSIPFRGQ